MTAADTPLTSNAVQLAGGARPLRVLLTHERFAPDFGGGGERVVLAIARYLMEAGVSVQVLTTGEPLLSEYEGIPTVRLPISRYAMNLAVPSIVKLARHSDLIQTFNYHACLPSLIAGRWTGRPVVCMFLGLIQQAWTDMRGRLLGRAWMEWERFLVTRHYSRLLFLTEDNRDAAIRLHACPARIDVNHPGITHGEFAPARQKDNSVLFVGKFDIRKGVHDVIEVARALPHIPFTMIGWGSLEAELKRVAPPNVVFHSIEDRLGLRRAMSRAAIFFLPSRGEGFPVALLEAMAAACAIVASVPLDFAGRRVPPGDRAAMLAAIEYLWNNPMEARRMGEANATLANTHSWEAHVSRLLTVYQELLR